ncbi:hypothetical protein EV586_103556 [Tumebacillus sp. BK434]|uniref:hypothetical protein n=1 Tax=Tumebacillus sp. BK434 TaxID=2512169 RepID=UPI00104E138C|nr:hypothetical protein [Tumebacillus sp. BK434]TCP55897.1 hypothetical protein EV586_103556 [Tumebacillus sp. BK434]
MAEKLFLLLLLTGASLLIGAVLYSLARHGRNLRRFRERQVFYTDLHRFAVLIVTAFALYLFETRIPLWSTLSGVPDAIPLFASTALPALLLCLLAGRWYLGFPAALLVEWCVLQSGGQTQYFLQNATLSLAGLLLYLLYTMSLRAEQKRSTEHRALTRFLAGKKEHGEEPNKTAAS